MYKDICYIPYWPSLVFSFKKQYVNLAEGFIIRVEIGLLGHRHLKVFAKTARDSHPISRLAVKVKGEAEQW